MCLALRHSAISLILVTVVVVCFCCGDSLIINCSCTQYDTRLSTGRGRSVTYNLYNIVAKASQGQQFNRVRGVNSF